MSDRLMTFKIALYALLLLCGSRGWSAVQQHLYLGTGLDADLNFGTRSLSVLEWHGRWQHWIAGAGGSISAGSYPVSSYFIETGHSQVFLPDLGLRLRLLNRYFIHMNRSENSVQPLLVWRYKGLEVEGGLNIRFMNSSGYLPALILYYPAEFVQYHWLIRVAGILDWQKLPLTTVLEIRNFDTWYADNSFTLSYHLLQTWVFHQGWKALLRVGLQPAGVTGMSTIYTTFVCLAGLEVEL